MRKVLWFVNHPISNINDLLHYSKSSGYWIEALANELKVEIELHVAFYFNKIKSKTVDFDNVTYHVLNYSKKTIFINQYIRLNVLDSEDLEVYKKIVFEVDPDIIHIHGTENSFGCLNDKINKPIVTSIQGFVYSVNNQGNSFFISSYTSNPFFLKLKKLYYFSLKNLENNFKRKLVNREFRNSSTIEYIIGRTDWDFYVSRILSPNSEYFHLNEIIRDEFYLDSNKWDFSKLGVNQLNIVSVCSTSSFKGFDLICNSLSILLRRGINVNWFVVGIPSNYFPSNINSDKYIAIKDSLFLLGFLKPEDIIQYMRKSHMYCMTSNIENSSNALSEALLLGMPCICNAVGGTISMVKHNHSGILLQQNDPISFSGAIISLFNDEKKMLYFSENARKDALIRHDKVTIKNKLLGIYNFIFNDYKFKKQTKDLC